MSAFICGDKTINRIITHLASDRELRQYYSNALSELHLGLDTAEQRQELGQELYLLNVAAVDQRYSEANETHLYKYQYELASRVQAYKSFRCFLYQCSEGDVPERPLFQLLTKLAESVCYSIVSALPAYEAAAWD